MLATSLHIAQVEMEEKRRQRGEVDLEFCALATEMVRASSIPKPPNLETSRSVHSPSPLITLSTCATNQLDERTYRDPISIRLQGLAALQLP